MAAVTDAGELLLVTVDPATRTVLASGELDHATAAVLTAAASELLRRPGPLTVDLSAVTFIDAGGLTALALLWGRQSRATQQLRVAGASARVSRTIAIGGLGALLDRGATRS